MTDDDADSERKEKYIDGTLASSLSLPLGCTRKAKKSGSTMTCERAPARRR